MTAGQRDELLRVADQLSGLALADIARSDHELALLEPVLAGARQRLRHGDGVFLLRGVPVAEIGDEAARRLFWLLGLCLGEPVSQNTAGELMTDVLDVGNDASDIGTRLYTTAAEQDFHTDGADLIGLLCLRTARSGGINRLVSSVTVFNEVLAERPDLAPLLLQDWHFHLHTLPDGTPVTVPLPIVRSDGEHLSTFFIPWYITRAQGLPGVPDLTAEQRELLQLYVETANRADLCLDMEFASGDLQWIKNATVLHKRTAYVDWPEPSRRRHLLRLWLAARDFDDGDELLRGGIPPVSAG